jgi:hypothetical protein
LKAVGGLNNASLDRCPVHAVFTNLVLYSCYTELLSARNFCIELPPDLFCSCPSGRFQCFGLEGSIHHQHPIRLSFEIRFGEPREVNFQEESAGFRNLLRSKIQEDIELLQYLVHLLIAKISVHPVVERYILEDSLRVRNLKNLGYELFGPVLSI